jgi:hypothetical protein
MALTFLNEVWSTRLLMDLAAESVYKQRGNQNYQADANNAKQVHIGKMTTDITISDYAKNTDISAPQLLTDEDTVLVMDQQKYFNFYVDDIAKAQTTPSFMSEAMRKSAIAIAQTIDSHVSARLITGTIANNMLEVTINDGDSVAEKGVAFLTAMSDLKTAMRIANISKSITPWAVISPGYLDVLEKYFLLEGKTGIFLPATSEQTLRSGFMGNLLGINLFWTNRAPQSANSGALKDVIIAGTTDAFTYADNVTETVAYRPEKRFGDAVKGLYVYGTKVTENKQLFTITNDGTST